MSGHSKWATIKRKKSANDIARGKIFTRLARELQVAAREGGPDPEVNIRLRLAVDKAKAENMPNDNIDRAIRRGAGLDKDAAEIEEVMYEGYGPGGVAFIVECLTDNRNRTIADIRRQFTRANGSLGEPNSVVWQFTAKGYIAINRFDADEQERDLDTDELFMAALDAGAEDVEIGDDVVEIFTEREDLAQVSQTLKDGGFAPDESELIMQPNTPLELSVQEGVAVLTLVESLEELDDVNKVYHNLVLTDDLVSEVA